MNTESNKQPLLFSIIIPVYNRPSEIDKLLDSLTKQTVKTFEVIVIEDGSSIRCSEQVDKYKSFLNIKYYYKNNTGPGLSRNYGCEKSEGDYYIFLDSDCVLPLHYIQTLYSSLMNDYADAFGGHDNAHPDFSIHQKAINYAMTSFLTTGGIRGGGEKLDKFYPRSFNMGYSRAVFSATKGFSDMRFGEDIDMSIRIIKNGFKTRLIKDAYVYHKRRTNYKQFFKQIYNSGMARINLYKKHPESLKLVHALPSLFSIGMFFLIVLSFFISTYFLFPILLFAVLLFFDATIRNKSILIGIWAIMASFIQLIAYGTGFLMAFRRRII